MHVQQFSASEKRRERLHRLWKIRLRFLQNRRLRSLLRDMLADRLIGREKLLSLFLEIKPSLYRYPALEENVFETKVREITDH